MWRAFNALPVFRVGGAARRNATSGWLRGSSANFLAALLHHYRPSRLAKGAVLKTVPTFCGCRPWQHLKVNKGPLPHHQGDQRPIYGASGNRGVTSNSTTRRSNEYIRENILGIKTAAIILRH